MLVLEQNVSIDGMNESPAIYQEGDKGKPAVLLAHGLMGDKNDYLNSLARIAEMLQE